MVRSGGGGGGWGEERGEEAFIFLLGRWEKGVFLPSNGLFAGGKAVSVPSTSSLQFTGRWVPLFTSSEAPPDLVVGEASPKGSSDIDNMITTYKRDHKERDYGQVKWCKF